MADDLYTQPPGSVPITPPSAVPRSVPVMRPNKTTPPTGVPLPSSSSSSSGNYPALPTAQQFSALTASSAYPLSAPTYYAPAPPASPWQQPLPATSPAPPPPPPLAAPVPDYHHQQQHYEQMLQNREMNLLRSLQPPLHRQAVVWVMAMTMVLCLAFVAGSFIITRSEKDMRHELDLQRRRLDEVNFSSSSGGGGGGVPREDPGDLGAAAEHIKIDPGGWSPSNCTIFVKQMRMATCAALRVPRDGAIDSWDQIERFDLCCLGEGARLSCGLPAELAPVTRLDAILGLYEGPGANEIVRRARNCRLYIYLWSPPQQQQQSG
jgi:hypothetical protein